MTLRLLAAVAAFPLTCAAPAQLRSTAAAVAVAACTPERNHCIRDETWFHVESVYPGSEARAVAVHETKPGRWESYEGDRALGGHILHTALAIPDQVKVRDILIVYRPNDGEPAWPVSEEAAQSESARWRVILVDAVDKAKGACFIQGRPDKPFPLAGARRVVESKDLPSTTKDSEP